MHTLRQMLVHRLQVWYTVASLFLSLKSDGYTCVSFFPLSEKGSTPRPRNTQLYLRETEALGVEGGLGTGGFEEWWAEYLRNK